MTNLAGSGVRVLLMGTGTHDSGSLLPDVLAVRQTLADLATAFIEACAVEPATLVCEENPSTSLEFGGAIRRAAEAATDVLIFYYVGHGVLSEDGELFLCTKATDSAQECLPWTGVSYKLVRQALRRSRAATTVVILDCCFSGRAVGGLGPHSPAEQAISVAATTGVYVLAAAAENELALAPAGDVHTAFSGELIDLLRRGDPQAGPNLTLQEVFYGLERRLRARQLPLPRRQVCASADGLVLAVNRAGGGDVLPMGRLVYDSEYFPDTFKAEWEYFNTRGTFDSEHFADLPGTARMRAEGAYDVGLNKRLEELSGMIECEYQVQAATPGLEPIYFCVIPMTTELDDPHLVEAGGSGIHDSRNATSPARERWPIAKADYDSRWHVFRQRYDLRSVTGVRYVMLGVRINEGRPSKCAGSATLRRVKVWAQE